MAYDADDKRDSPPRDRLKLKSRGNDIRAARKGGRSLPRVRLRPKRSDGEVGYGRPPAKTRFKPGQSGNPKGRPKGAKGESTILREILSRKITIHSDGRRRKISILEAIHLRIAEDCLKGNTKSATFLLNRYAALVSGELQPHDLGEDDREVFDAFTRRLAQRAITEGDS